MQNLKRTGLYPRLRAYLCDRNIAALRAAHKSGIPPISLYQHLSGISRLSVKNAEKLKDTFPGLTLDDIYFRGEYVDDDNVN